MVCVTCGGQVEAGARYCPRSGRAMAPGPPGAAGTPGAPPGPAAGANLIDDLQDHLHRFAGTNRLEGFIGFVGWMVVFGLVQDGLRQIRSAQAVRRAAGGATRGGTGGVISGAAGGAAADTTDLVGP
ncbi:MAG: hypothetical protein ABW020_01945 [Candidatus Rokuibacteriota bacterium]